MRRVVFVAVAIAIVLAIGASQADAVTGPLYGPGFQWLRDDDGDGIPNHLDDDWFRPLDGTGYKMKHALHSPTACAPSDPSQHRNMNMIWVRNRNGQDVPSAYGDQIKDRLRIHDGKRDRDQLRLKDGSCQ